MTNGESSYKTVNLVGREIQVAMPTEGQFALLTLQTRALRRKEVDLPQAFAAMGGIMAVIEKIIHPDDREYVADQLLEGEIGTEDLLGLLHVFGEEEADAKPVRAVRRATKR